MRDILLFQLLSRGALEDARVPALLRELRDLTLRDRVPFFAFLVDLCEEKRNAIELQDLALRALVGATGLPVIELARAALEDPALRSSALAVLREAASRGPGRWIFAALHASDDVRAEAYRGRVPEGAGQFDLALLADPVLRSVAETRLLARDGGVEPFESAMAIDVVRAGFLSGAVLLKLMRKKHFAGLLPRWVDARPPATVSSFLSEVEVDGAFDASKAAALHDALDVLVPHLEPSDVSIMSELVVQVGGRLAVSAAVLRSRGNTSAALAIAIVLSLPSVLATTFLSRAEESRVVEALLANGSRGVRLDLSDIRRLLATRFVRDDAGLPSAGRVAAALSFAPRSAIATLLEVFTSIEVAAMMLEPAAAARLLSVPDTDTEARPRLWAIVETLASELHLAIEVAFVETAPPGLLGDHGSDRSMKLLPRTLEIARVDAERAMAFAQSFHASRSPRVLELVIEASAPGAVEVCPVLLRALFHRAIDVLSIDAVASLLAVAPVASLKGLLARFSNDVESLPFGLERSLADRFAVHADAELAAWARARQPAAAVPASQRRRAGVAFDKPSGAPDVPRCVELLGSFDPVAATDGAFFDCSRDEPSFLGELGSALVSAYATRRDALSPLGHAMLWRFEFHAFAHLDALLAEHATLLEGVRARAALRSRILARESLLAVASVLGKLAARDKSRFGELVSDALIDVFCELLSTDLEESAAELFRALAASKLVDLAPYVGRLRVALTEVSSEVRARLASVVDDAGLEHMASPARRRVAMSTDGETLARVRETADLSLLGRLLGDEREVVVHEVTLRLIMLGEAGCLVLATALEAPGALLTRSAVVVASCVSLWPEGSARERARAKVVDEACPLPVRFRLAMAFTELGDRTALVAALELVVRETTERFFEAGDFVALVTAQGRLMPDSSDPEGVVSRALAASPHPRAHVPAVELLVSRAVLERADLEALAAFLLAGSTRMTSHRRRAASRLFDAGDATGLSVLLANELESSRGSRKILHGLEPSLVVTAVRSALVAGNDILKESVLLDHLRGIQEDAALAVYPVVLREAQTDKLRVVAAAELSRPMLRARKIEQIVGVFLWGQRVARLLLGRRMRVKMTGTLKLGFTRLRENVVYVTPLPMLRGDRHGQEVVEALVLHELGHHLYHAGPTGEAVWKQAEDEGIHGLFNLVADEHLERNLRAIDPAYGDRLKRLAAYAFQHTSKDILISRLLSTLGSSTFAVVSKAGLGVAREADQVRVESGALLFGMEKQGLAFARFARALRMGLGNRHADPRVEEALALFGSKFKQSSMEELLAIARRLKEIFGWETSLAESFGPHESLEAGNGEANPDAIEWGEGITQDEVDKMVERFTSREEGGSSGPGTGGKLALNMNEDTKFDPLRQIVHKPHDPEAHAPYRRRVEQPASVLRSYLSELGIGWVSESMRLSGRRVDRSRLLRLVVHGDPRVLVARRPVEERDLFLGIAIDCSGSMASGGNIEKAKLFATLVTEAVAPLSKVDVRVFGFTDEKLFDCGDARRSGVAGLRSEGGNNDAAALHHVASLAKASARRAKVLTMISDGLPTQCSVAALKNVVNQLTVREKMVVAQVAVQPLAEVCFPHYVVLQDADINVTVRKFGGVIADLVRRAMRS